MPISYTLDLDQQLLLETWTGLVTANEVRHHWQAAIADRKARTLRRTLADLRGCQIGFSAEELHAAVTELLLPAMQHRDWVTAMLVTSKEQFRVSAAYQSVAILYSLDSIFIDPKAARAWLAKQQLRVA